MTLRVDIRKKLPGFTLNIRMHCPCGQLMAVVGPSGAGKSTMMRIIAGLEKPDEGRISFEDDVWVDTEARIFLPPRKRRLGLVFQDYTLFPHLTVAGNVGFAARRQERVPQLLRLFGIAHLADKKPKHISGGERQRAAICQALATEPVLLLLDEPFSALDQPTRLALRRELGQLKRELALPILHVTHDLEEAAELGDAVLPIVGGAMRPDWPPVAGLPRRSDNDERNATETPRALRRDHTTGVDESLPASVVAAPKA